MASQEVMLNMSVTMVNWDLKAAYALSRSDRSRDARSISLSSSGDKSVRAMGPMSPPLAFDPESETSDASCAKGSPPSRRSRR